MIDLHAHILPGIDDGPRDTVAAVALAEAAIAAGTSVLVATPHLRPEHPRVRLHELEERVGELNAVLCRYALPLVVRGGAEVGFWTALELSDEQLRAASIAGNGRDVLLEPPDGPLPSSFPELVGGLQERGFRIVLAHPERVDAFQDEPERLGELVAAGVLCQLTASAIAARPRRSAVRRLALLCLRHGWAHSIASDTHGAMSRPPDLRPAVFAAARAMGGSGPAATWLVDEAPAAVLAGASLPPRPSVADSAPRRLSLRRSRNGPIGSRR